MHTILLKLSGKLKDFQQKKLVQQRSFTIQVLNSKIISAIIFPMFSVPGRLCTFSRNNGVLKYTNILRMPIKGPSSVDCICLDFVTNGKFFET